MPVEYSGADRDGGCPCGGRFEDIHQESRVSTGQPPGDVPHKLWVPSRFLWGFPQGFSPSHSPQRCLQLCVPPRKCHCLCVEGTSPAPCTRSRVSPGVTPLSAPVLLQGSGFPCPYLVTRLVFGLGTHWGFLPPTVRGEWHGGAGEEQPQALGVAQRKGGDVSLSWGCGVLVGGGEQRGLCLHSVAALQEGRGGDRGSFFTWR